MYSNELRPVIKIHKYKKSLWVYNTKLKRFDLIFSHSRDPTHYLPSQHDCVDQHQNKENYFLGSKVTNFNQLHFEGAGFWI